MHSCHHFVGSPKQVDKDVTPTVQTQQSEISNRIICLRELGEIVFFYFQPEVNRYGRSFAERNPCRNNDNIFLTNAFSAHLAEDSPAEHP